MGRVALAHVQKTCKRRASILGNKPLGNDDGPDCARLAGRQRIVKFEFGARVC